MFSFLLSFQMRLFLFRRDLRTIDQRGLEACVRAAEKEQQKVTLGFVFDPAQVDPAKNPYYSPNAVRFMLESLRDLHTSVPVHFWYTEDPTEPLRALLSSGLTDVHWNQDYTPFAQKRDATLRAWCEAQKPPIQVHEHQDYLLVPPTHPASRTNGGKGDGYRVFTPYYRSVTVALQQESDTWLRVSSWDIQKARTWLLSPPAKQMQKCFARVEKHIRATKERLAASPIMRGGREEAMYQLARVKKYVAPSYETQRDMLGEESTTQMSAFLKFGAVSIREAARAWKQYPALLRQLHWRDFYMQLVYHYPYVLTERRSLYPHFDDCLQSWWRKEKDPETKQILRRVEEGRTGVPIIDAAVSQLRSTGWMHNRARMTVASFVTKDLRVDWRWGERWFARWLVDYDPASNSGGWQWASSVGADAAPYFRVFHPWRQQERFDPSGTYVDHWSPSILTESPLVTSSEHTALAKASMVPFLGCTKKVSP